uniref:Uncharacterized protein n=1 Tax=Ananas comosus var. bracteatus TaxID=296719 RepID=A0A6V7Q214_ANACO|nr:unnamed protein product [Ananas comosus var. bracteatus]
MLDNVPYADAVPVSDFCASNNFLDLSQSHISHIDPVLISTTPQEHHHHTQKTWPIPNPKGPNPSPNPNPNPLGLRRPRRTNLRLADGVPSPRGVRLPPGILPAGVASYLLRQDGSFEVYLSEDNCEFKIAGQYQLKYRRKITGTVRSGAIKNLNGVSVKVLFLWIGINEVDRSGDELSFYVGPLSASFGVSNFEESPRCSCGFDCATAAAAAAASS